MTMNCMAPVAVAAPGTPVPLAGDPNVTPCKLFLQVIPGFTGKTYAGTRSMNKSTMAGVARILWPNSAGGFSESFFIESQDVTNSIRLMDYAIDADVSGEGLLVTYWTE